MKSKLFFPFALLFLLWMPSRLQAQCEPVAICVDLLHVSIGFDDPNDCYGPAGFNNTPPALDSNHFAGASWVKAELLDEGSYDPCYDVKVRIQRMPPYSDFIQNLNSIRGTVPCDANSPTSPSEFERATMESDSIKFYCGEVGTTQTLVFRAYQVDSNGNYILNGSGQPIYTECYITTKVEDKIKPACVAPAPVTVSCENFDSTLIAYGTPTIFENCCLDTMTQTVAYDWYDTLCNKGTVTRTFRVFDCSGNSSKCTQNIVVTAPFAGVSGKVFVDTLDNCAYDGGEPPLENWLVRITGLVSGEVYEVLTDSLGEYEKEFVPVDTVVEVTLVTTYNFGQNCPSVYTVNVASGETTSQDIPAHLRTDCPLLSVDVSAPFLRRCFPNTYTVKACNLSSSIVEDAHVEVTLDSYMTFNSSSIPSDSLGNNVWSFELGDLIPGECLDFQIFFNLNCTAPLGYTHCTEAHIFPDSLCDTPPNWSGADLEVTGFCDGDSVRLTITNVGAGDMTEEQGFVVVEDIVMYLAQPFQLNSGADITFSLPANGATWRLETDEVVNHPWGGVEAKAVEGCGGLNMTGLVTMFSFNTPDPFETIDCQENIGSYDPNDKRAFPKGYGVSHFIEANTDIEYHIRFQNTGTDTAFTVVMLDTLSQHLDAASVRPGASSHDYEFALLDGNVLRFRFDNILLPDSNVNEPASHGFVKFSVPQKPDNADGTLIENNAAIYFDFNDPIITNTTFHTIGDHFILVKTDEPAAGVLKVYPNPSVGAVFFELPEIMRQGRFELTNSLGQILRSEHMASNPYRFERGLLPTGLYFYKISDGANQIFTGKILLK